MCPIRLVISSQGGHTPSSLHRSAQAFRPNGSRLVTCSSTESSRKLQDRAVARRAETIRKLRDEHLQRRLNDHESDLDVTADTASSVLFDGETTFIVEPELTEGPYYVRGELIRTDMREKQTGVTMYIDFQVINVNDCTPVKDIADQSNLQNTFLRGVTPTDDDGVAEMISIFPGHYAGRTTHLHFIGNYGGTVLSNKTYAGSSVAHVGQFFFEQDLIDAVEAVTPYSTNKQTLTATASDNIYKAALGNNYDQIMNYALLGSSVNDGVFVWISVAVDMTAERVVKAVSTLEGSETASSASESSSGSTSGSLANTTTANSNHALKPSVFSGAAMVLLAAIAQMLL
ncbi:hypothetical protein AM588_10002749 [Phytophthora nicotianae]|uniref:Intradiol ring-cleavage dioxygenases domain-containing protein n=2 Tax=Phytophthora nicotianae TaxID=4792 RepID=A0A0W8D2G4_PHYNI|nr:hypothetical protein AM588_10002749 [Phytophthora nicotianae]